MSGAAIRVEGLRFSYPDGREALRGIDLTVGAGERLAILGPNGAGKTTLALHLNGIHLPDAGAVEIDGTAVSKATAREVRARVGMLFQDPDDQLFMPTVAEDVAFGPKNFGSDEHEVKHRVAEALRRVGLSDEAESAPQSLSLGQRRRAAIAGILAMNVDVMVLDEPTSNLDPRGRRELLDALSTFDGTQVVVTHDLPFALQLCGRAVIVDHGQVVADAPTRALLADAALLERHGLELPWGFRLAEPAQ